MQAALPCSASVSRAELSSHEKVGMAAIHSPPPRWRLV